MIQLCYSHKNLRYLKWSVEDDLNRLVDWFKANKLTLNLDKTVCVLFSNQSKPQKVTLEIGTYRLQSSDIVKFLGVLIDNKLNWNKHINFLIAKFKQNLLLKLSNKFLNKSTNKLIYYAHMYSHITYGILIWGNMINQLSQNNPKNYKHKLQFNNRTNPHPRQLQKGENAKTF